MNHDDLDTRVTAYVFGELSPEETAALEREISQSSQLRDEVHAIRETIGALKIEFDAKATRLGDSQRQAIEQAIEQHSAAGSVRVDRAHGRSHRTPLIAAVLAASVLIVCALSYPYLADQNVALVTEQDQLLTEQNQLHEASDAAAPTEIAQVDDLELLAETEQESIDSSNRLSFRSGDLRDADEQSVASESGKPMSARRSRLVELQIVPSEKSNEPMMEAEAEGLRAQQSARSMDVALGTSSPASQAKSLAQQRGVADKEAPLELSGERKPAGEQSLRRRYLGRDGRTLDEQQVLDEQRSLQQAAERPSPEPPSSDRFKSDQNFGLQPPAQQAPGLPAENQPRLPAENTPASGAKLPLNQAGMGGRRQVVDGDDGVAVGEGGDRGTLQGGYGLPKDTTDMRGGGARSKGRAAAEQVTDMLNILEKDELREEAPSPFGSRPQLKQLETRAAIIDEAEEARPAAANGAESKKRSLPDSSSLAAAEPEAANSRGSGIRLETESRLSREAIITQPALAPEPALVPEPALGDRFEPIEDNPFIEVASQPLSTFSIDVDTASYAKVRSRLNAGALPRPDAVRIEELLNYFDYDYAPPEDDLPFAASMEIASCPWNPQHRLARIGIKGKIIEETRPGSNLVFLLDVSGSMKQADKFPLMIKGMKMLTNQLTENDTVSIVVYADAAGQVLEPTRGDKKEQILAALDRLSAGGSTNGAQGIVLAYRLARENFITGGINRVILCTDGDFNVGVTGDDQLVRLAQDNAQSNVFLSVLGFGSGNHNDAMMEKVSNSGNGNYGFIDSESEAEKVFVAELSGTLVTIAKDVKIQIEFNPKEVASYRLIGYENRKLAAQDFNDDTKDAGEIGAGHTVTALYEIVPAGVDDVKLPSIDKLRYQRQNRLSKEAHSGETLVLKLRYKQPEGTTSEEIDIPVRDSGKQFSQADQDFQFAASVAAFGMLLRDSPHKGNATFAAVAEIAAAAIGEDEHGYRQEFLDLVAKAKELRGE